MCVQYQEAFVNILEFISEKLLGDNLENIIKCKESYNEENSACISKVLFKGEYAVFIYSLQKRVHPRLELIDAYEKLGFVELYKIETHNSPCALDSSQIVL